MPSIKRVVEKVEEKIEENLPVMEEIVSDIKEIVTEIEVLLESNDENAKLILNQYIESKIPEERYSLISLLQKIYPKIVGKELCFTFQSEQQALLFEDVRPYLLGYTNTRLKDKLDIVKVEIDNTVELGNKDPYTDKEKFQYLLDKHPTLREATEVLGLKVKD